MQIKGVMRYKYALLRMPDLKKKTYYAVVRMESSWNSCALPVGCKWYTALEDNLTVSYKVKQQSHS